MAVKHVNSNNEKMRKICEKVRALQAMGYIREVGDPFSDTEWCLHNNLSKDNIKVGHNLSSMWRHTQRGKDKVLGVGFNTAGQPMMSVFTPKDMDNGHYESARYAYSYVCGQSEQSAHFDRHIVGFLKAFVPELQAAGVQGVPEIYILCSGPLRYRVKYMNGRTIVILF